jgi:hypothetical protein
MRSSKLSVSKTRESGAKQSAGGGSEQLKTNSENGLFILIEAYKYSFDNKNI